MKLDHDTKVNVESCEPADSRIDDHGGYGTLYVVRYTVDGIDGSVLESCVRAWFGLHVAELEVEDLTLGSFSPRAIVNTVGKREAARHGMEWRDVE